MDTLPAVQSGKEVYSLSTNAAGLCGAIVKQTAQDIKGKKYVRVEGWQAIATAHGCVASSRDVEKVDGGIKAIGEIRRMVDGSLIATAEGFVGDDEKTWASRPEYARRAMAQTRAISRVCRSAFAHVVVLIDAGLQTTPAEEIPTDAADQTTAAMNKGKSKGISDDYALPRGKYKEKPFRDLTEKQLLEVWEASKDGGSWKKALGDYIDKRFGKTKEPKDVTPKDAPKDALPATDFDADIEAANRRAAEEAKSTPAPPDMPISNS